MRHFNGLSPAEAERLACLAEEMGEAIQVIGKILRHGYESYHPDSPKITNRMLLEKELGDVDMIIDFMQRKEDISQWNIAGASVEKLGKIDRYWHHNSIKDVSK